MGRGAGKVCESLLFRSVAVLNEDTTWGRGAADAFLDVFLSTEGAQLLNNETREFHNGNYSTARIAELIGGLEAVNAKIIFLAAHPTIQKEFSTTSTAHAGCGGASIRGLQDGPQPRSF